MPMSTEKYKNFIKIDWYDTLVSWQKETFWEGSLRDTNNLIQAERNLKRVSVSGLALNTQSFQNKKCPNLKRDTCHQTLNFSFPMNGPGEKKATCGKGENLMKVRFGEEGSSILAGETKFLKEIDILAKNVSNKAVKSFHTTLETLPKNHHLGSRYQTELLYV